MNLLVAEKLNLSAHPNPTILDIGCGFGITAYQLSHRLPNSIITGIDHSMEQVAAIAKEIGGKKNEDRLQFVVADFQSMPFHDASFDAAYALESACFAEGETKGKLLHEAARVLRPGGKLVVVDGFRKHGRALPLLVDWLYRRCITAWGMPSLAAIDGFAEELKNQGFADITVKDISWSVAPSLLHIPFTALKVFIAHLFENDQGQLRYLHALLLTLALSPFKKHFGYFTVTCIKTTVELEK